MLQEIVDSLEMRSDEFRNFLDCQTGKVEYVDLEGASRFVGLPTRRDCP